MVSKVRNFWLCVFSGVVATTLMARQFKLAKSRIQNLKLTSVVKSDDIFRWSLFSAAIQSSSTVITYCSKHVTSSVVSISDDVVKFMFNMRKQENTFPPTLRGRNSSCNRNLSEVLSTRPDFGLNERNLICCKRQK